MSVLVRFRCDGCPAVTEEAPAWRHAKQVGHSLIAVPTVEASIEEAAEKVAPGWTIYDPWTRCVYCPACWECITEHPSGCGDNGPCELAEVTS